jgi:hypothetical protein
MRDGCAHVRDLEAADKVNLVCELPVELLEAGATRCIDDQLVEGDVGRETLGLRERLAGPGESGEGRIQVREALRRDIVETPGEGGHFKHLPQE